MTRGRVAESPRTAVCSARAQAGAKARREDRARRLTSSPRRRGIRGFTSPAQAADFVSRQARRACRGCPTPHNPLRKGRQLRPSSDILDRCAPLWRGALRLRTRVQRLADPTAIPSDAGSLREDRVSLAGLFESKFRGDIRFRGQAYLEADRVAVTRVLPDHLFAVVRDGDEYQTQLSRQERRPADVLLLRRRRFDQANPPASTCGRRCWPSMSGRTSADIRPAATSLQFQSHTEPAFDLDRRSRRRPRRRRRLPAGHADGAAAPDRAASHAHCATRLGTAAAASCGTRSPPPAASPSVPSSEREIFYEVDLEESCEAGELVIQTSQRQRRTSGQWGKLKPLKLRPGKLDDIETRGRPPYPGVPRRRYSGTLGLVAQQAEFQSSTLPLSDAVRTGGLLLPMMCATAADAAAG